MKEDLEDYIRVTGVERVRSEGVVLLSEGAVLNGTVLSRCAVAWTMHDLDVVTPWSGEQ